MKPGSLLNAAASRFMCLMGYHEPLYALESQGVRLTVDDWSVDDALCSHPSLRVVGVHCACCGRTLADSFPWKD